jgi:hypothetical protein
MKINILPVGDPSLDALFDRVYIIADARGIQREEAIRNALRRWIDIVVEGAEGPATPSRCLETTEAEFEAFKVVLAAMRAYHHT